MVPNFSLAAMFFTLSISFLLPVILFIFFRRSSKNITGAVIAGAIAFYLSQIVIRLQLLQLLPKFDWYKTIMQNPFLFIIILALSAALFEETARYIVFQLLLKEKQVWKCGIAYGIGHGGIESIIIVGLTYINNIVLSILINTNRFHLFLENKVAAGLSSQIFRSLVDTPSGIFIAAGVERALTICIQIALSVLVLEGIVRKRRIYFYSAAVAVHAAVNFIAAYMSYQKVNYWIIELGVALFAGVGLIYILTSRKRFADKIEAEDEAIKAVEEGY